MMLDTINKKSFIALALCILFTLTGCNITSLFNVDKDKQKDENKIANEPKIEVVIIEDSPIIGDKEIHDEKSLNPKIPKPNIAISRVASSQPKVNEHKTTKEQQKEINQYVNTLIDGYDEILSKNSSRRKLPLLWDIVKKGMTFNTKDHKYKTKEWLQALEFKRDFHKLLENGNMYAYYIVNEIKKRNMPMELALIPLVESGFNPNATSYAKAVGLWQIIPSTAKYLHLKQDWSYDMRKDIVKSTNAALSYFAYLYRRFNDWDLAIAAYNMGETNVRAAQKKNKEKGLPTDLWSIPIHKNGLIYVERLYAFSEILKNSKKYGVTYPDIPYKPYFKKVKLRDRVTTNYIAKYTGVPLKTIESLNPGFSSPNYSTKLVDTVLVPLNAANKIPSPPKAKKKKNSQKSANKSKTSNKTKNSSNKKNNNKNKNRNNQQNSSNKNKK